MLNYLREQTKFIHKEIEKDIGALYVIEGSMLGTLLLSRNIIECDNLKNITSHSFFNLNNHKEKVNNWKSFSDIVNNKVFSESERKDASLVAEETFRLFSSK